MKPEDFKSLRDTTRKLSVWKSTGKCFGHFQILEQLESQKKVQDRIYEFYCLLRVLEDLKKNYKIELINNPKNDKVFPQAPGKKENYTYFKLSIKSDPSSGFQVCFGTKIALSKVVGKFIAPDISFQILASPLNPTESDVLLIMDPKYKFDSKKSLTTNELEKFMHWVHALQTSNASSEPIDFDELTDLLGNSLLTNGNYIKGQEEYCKAYFVKQVSNFSLDVTARVVVG